MGVLWFEIASNQNLSNGLKSVNVYVLSSVVVIIGRPTRPGYENFSPAPRLFVAVVTFLPIAFGTFYRSWNLHVITCFSVVHENKLFFPLSVFSAIYA
jgi:hypothetical protein